MRDRFFYPILTLMVDSFSCSILNNPFYFRKACERRPENPEYAEMRHCDRMLSRIDARLFDFYIFHRLERVCEKNRIHHLCSVGTEKSQPEGPPFQWETRLAKFPTEWWTRGLGFFQEPLNTNDRFFFSYTTTVRYSTVYVSVGDVTEVDVYTQ